MINDEENPPQIITTQQSDNKSTLDQPTQQSLIITNDNEQSKNHLVLPNTSKQAEEVTAHSSHSSLTRQKPVTTLASDGRAESTPNATNNATNPVLQQTMCGRDSVERLLQRLNWCSLMLIVPGFMFISAMMRVNAQSLLYLVWLLCLPFLYPVNKFTIAMRLKKYLYALCALSVFLLFSQAIFQIYLVANNPYGNEKILPNCSMKQEILEELGFPRLDTALPLDIVRLFASDVLMLVVSVVALCLCRRVHEQNLTNKREKMYVRNDLLMSAPQQTQNASSSTDSSNNKDNKKKKKKGNDMLQPNATTTTFTDHFLPLANVSQEPTRDGVFVAQIATSAVQSEAASISSSTGHNENEEDESDEEEDNEENNKQPPQLRKRSSVQEGEVLWRGRLAHQQSLLYHSSNIQTLTDIQSPRQIRRIRPNARNMHSRLSQMHKLLTTLMPIIQELMFMCLLLVCGTLWPSMLSLPYFLSFVFLFSKWSFAGSTVIGSKFQVNIKLALTFYTALHLLLLYLYQFELFHSNVPSQSLLSRLLGLNMLIYSKCTLPIHVFFSSDLRWQQMSQPLALLMLYWFLTLELAFMRGKQRTLSLLQLIRPPRTPGSIAATNTLPTNVPIGNVLDQFDNNLNNNKKKTKRPPSDLVINEEEMFLQEYEENENDLDNDDIEVLIVDQTTSGDINKKSRNSSKVIGLMKRSNLHIRHSHIIDDDDLTREQSKFLRSRTDSTTRIVSDDNDDISDNENDDDYFSSSSLSEASLNESDNKSVNELFDNKVKEKRKMSNIVKRLFNKNLDDSDQNPTSSNVAFNDTLKLRRIQTLKPNSNDTEQRVRLNSVIVNVNNTLAGEAGNRKFGMRRQTSRRQLWLENLKIYCRQIIIFLNRQSYLLALVSMMAWSIMYHSVLTLVLLIWACFIWVMPNSRHVCLRSSPFIVFYATILLFLEFVYGLQLTDTELQQFEQIGLIKHKIPFVDLCMKTGFLLFLWFTLRQHVKAKHKQASILISSSRVMESVIDEEHQTQPQRFDEQNPPPILKLQSQISNWIYIFLIKYWIYLSSLCLLLMSCQDPVVAYRIGYMILFLWFVITFQLTNRLWRVSLYAFHLIVIVYSMVVLILIYVFQFKDVPEFVMDLFGIDNLILRSIGFVRFDNKDQLFTRLLTPTTFLIVNILQIHYFNEPWLRLTDPKQFQNRKAEEVPNQQEQEQTAPTTSAAATADAVPSVETAEDQVDEKKKKEEFFSFLLRNFKLVTNIYFMCTVHMWRLAELHIYKCIIIFISLSCFHTVNLMNLILLGCVLLSMIVDRLCSNSKQLTNEKTTHAIASAVFMLIVSLYTLCSMIYQMELFVDSPFHSNCTFGNTTVVDPYLLQTNDNLEFIGLNKSKDIQSTLAFFIFIFLLLTLEKLIKLKMKFYRLKNNLMLRTNYSLLFDNVTWKDSDLNFTFLFKYCCNFFFYRFGLELCFIMNVITITVRMDAYAILYGLWLCVFINLKRETIKRTWRYYFCFLMLFVPLQYVFCLGLPPILCLSYPWYQSDPLTIINKLRVWLFLPSYSMPPNPNFIIVDFLHVFLVWLQFSVFQMETSAILIHDNNKNPTELNPNNEISNNDQSATVSTTEVIDIIELGGSNKELRYEEQPYKDQPFHDFVSETQGVLDVCKYFVYMYSYWFVLAIVYLTGTSRISLLCMGYVIMSFFFLWYGQTFLKKPIQKILQSWNYLLFYCLFVIFLKACLQIVLCLLTNEIDSGTICILIDIFGIDCRTLTRMSGPLTSKSVHVVTCYSESSSSHTNDVGLFWDVFCFVILLIQRRLFMSYLFQHVANEFSAQSHLAARGADIFREIIYNKITVDKKREERILKKLQKNVDRIRERQSKEHKHEPTEHFETLRSGDYFMFDEEFERYDQELDEMDLDLDTLRQQSQSKTASVAEPEKKDDKEEKKLDTIEEKKEETGKKKEKKKKGQKSWLTIENKHLLACLTFLRKYAYKFIDFLIEYFDKHSKDYRKVSRILSKEKKKLKAEYGNTSAPFLTDLIQSRDDGLTQLHETEMEKIEIEEKKKMEEEEQHQAEVAMRRKNSNADSETEDEEEEEEEDNINRLLKETELYKYNTRLYKLMSSLFYFMLSQSEILCYLSLILNHLMSASLLSLPLPLSVFLWAMLCIPRPTKNYWITTITYIEVVVVVKYMFQFKLFPWNKFLLNSDKPSASIRLDNDEISALTLLGIDRKAGEQFAIFDLFSLMIIFLHRTILKRMGLWRNSNEDDDALFTANEINLEKQEKEKEKREEEEEEEKEYQEEVVDEQEQIKKRLEEQNDEQEELCRNRKMNLEPPIPDPYNTLEEGDCIKTRLIQQQIQQEEEDFYDDKQADDPMNDTNIFDQVYYDEHNMPLRIKRLKDKMAYMEQKSCITPLIKFFNNMNSKHYAVVVDCFAKIFMCDFLNCLLTVFFYQYFGEAARVAAKGTSNAIASIQDNKVPYSFLIMFLIQFILMIIDRALYLRKNRRGKYIFQFILVIFVHIWVFFILPFITKLSFTENTPVQVWYFIKCMYFGFSSRQIRCGYPTRILGNFLTKSYNYVNWVLFKCFLLVPFLLELRSLMDWMFTDTSLGLADWLQMEDIYSNIFVLKCARYNEKKYPIPRGSKRRALVKYGFGGFLLGLIILIIWFPLLLFSFSEGFGESVNVRHCQIDIELSGYLPLYSMTSQNSLAHQYTEDQFRSLQDAAPEESWPFLKDFDFIDVYCISIPGISTSLWQTSPPSMQNLKDQLKSLKDINMNFAYSITRSLESNERKNTQFNEVVSAEREFAVQNDTKKILYDILTNSGPTSVRIDKLYPKFVHARSKGNIQEISSMKYSSSFPYYSNVTLALKNESNMLWWDVYDNLTKSNDVKASYASPCSKPGYLNIVIFSDKVAPSSISFITEQGIIGLYSTFIILIAQFVRDMMVGSPSSIMFNDLPCVDRLWKLLLDILLVRSMVLLKLETELYDKLIYIYRNPELLIRVTENPVEKIMSSHHTTSTINNNNNNDSTIAVISSNSKRTIIKQKSDDIENLEIEHNQKQTMDR